ncbi:MAG: diacylglycerol/lipid kinase family protein [Lachnospiraceae bacterium]
MYTFIVNPNARTGLGHKVWKDLETHLQSQNVNYQVFFTKYQRHATEITKKVTSSNSHCTLIVLGGDGTVNEVINGISELPNVTLGYIPIGSSNDFSRGLKLSSNPLESLKHILSPSRFTYINIGTLNYGSGNRRFAVSSGIGFDAEVCHKISFSKLKIFLNKVKLGKLSYAGVAIQSILLQTPQKMTITLDNNRTVSFNKTYFAAFMNQKYEGGGFMFCPKAEPGDDILDLIVIEGLSKLKILFLLPTAFFGKHVYFRGIHTYQCKSAKIQSETALCVHTDGEDVFLQTEISGALESEKLRIIVS